MATHEYYNQLTESEREKLDEIYSDLSMNLRKAGLPVRNDDTAERIVEAIARGIIHTKPLANV